MKTLTKAQHSVLMCLNDVAENEGGEIMLKHKYHSAAASLVRRGLVDKRDCWPYRPRYIITAAGRQLWRENYAKVAD